MTPLIRFVVGDGDEAPEAKALIAASRPRAMASMAPLVRSVVGDGDEAPEVKALGDEELALKALGGEGERRIASFQRFDRRPRHILREIPGR